MAHRILGLDIGHTSIRLAVVDKTLRQATWSGFDEEPLPASGDDLTRQEAIRRLIARNQRPDDVVAMGAPTALALHRSLTFPFRDDKAIAEAVGFELENHIPTPIADLVVDFVRTGEKDGQTEVLAIAVPRKDVEDLLDTTLAAGLDVRRLGLNVLSYASLVRAVPELASGVTLFVDVGSRTAEFSVLVDGRTQTFRSVSAGSQTLHETFAGQFATDGPQDDLLRTHGMLLAPGMTAETPEERLLHDATATALGPLLRELRLTLSMWLRRSHRRPDRLVLTGGLAGLRGIYDFLQGAMGIPVVPLRLEQLPFVKVANAGQLGDRAALCLAQALAAADLESDLDVDLRQGDLAYEGDFQVLRQRLPQVAVFLVLALCLLGIRTSLNYRALIMEQEQQVSQLAGVTKQLTGKAIRDFDLATAELNKQDTVDMAALYPDLSAFKVLEELSRIHDRVTEPPDYTGEAAKPAGGPAEAQPPQLAQAEAGAVDPAMAPQAPALRGLPGRGGDGMTTLGGRNADATALRNLRARLPTAGVDGAARIRGATTPPNGDPTAEGAAPEPPTRDAGGAGPAPDADPAAPADGGAGADKKAFAGHQIEFTAVQIERSRGTVRGEADTQDALLALQQAVDAHRCFGKAKSSSDRITFERHRDWFKFTIEFEIACPSAEVESDEEDKKADKAAAEEE